MSQLNKLSENIIKEELLSIIKTQMITFYEKKTNTTTELDKIRSQDENIYSYMINVFI